MTTTTFTAEQTSFLRFVARRMGVRLTAGITAAEIAAALFAKDGSLAEFEANLDPEDDRAAATVTWFECAIAG